MRRVVFNQKGGVGKSTITVNLAAAAAISGKRVLVVDLDPQCNASHYLVGEAYSTWPSVADYFDGVLNFNLLNSQTEQFTASTQWAGLDLMAAHPRLAEQMTKLETRYKMFKLKEALDHLNAHYDEIWIDTPPHLNFFTRSALIAADRCLIPFDCDTFSLQALMSLLSAFDEIRADHNPHLLHEGIIVNQFQSRASLPQRLIQQLKDENLPVLTPPLSASIRVKESHEACCPIVFFDAKHKVSLEFIALYQTLSPKQAFANNAALTGDKTQAANA